MKPWMMEPFYRLDYMIIAAIEKVLHVFGICLGG